MSPFPLFSVSPIRRVLCGFSSLHLFGVFPKARLAVAQCTMMERVLGISHFRRIAFPSLEHGSLQSAPVRKAQLPRQALDTIHGVQMFGGLQIALTAGEKHNTRHGRRNDA